MLKLDSVRLGSMRFALRELFEECAADKALLLLDGRSMSGIDRLASGEMPEPEAENTIPLILDKHYRFLVRPIMEGDEIKGSVPYRELTSNRQIFHLLYDAGIYDSAHRDFQDSRVLQVTFKGEKTPYVLARSIPGHDINAKVRSHHIGFELEPNR